MRLPHRLSCLDEPAAGAASRRSCSTAHRTPRPSSPCLPCTSSLASASPTSPLWAVAISVASHGLETAAFRPAFQGSNHMMRFIATGDACGVCSEHACFGGAATTTRRYRHDPRRGALSTPRWAFSDVLTAACTESIGVPVVTSPDAHARGAWTPCKPLSRRLQAPVHRPQAGSFISVRRSILSVSL